MFRMYYCTIVHIVHIVCTMFYCKRGIGAQLITYMQSFCVCCGIRHMVIIKQMSNEHWFAQSTEYHEENI